MSPAALCRGQVKGARRRDCELRETVAQTSRCLDDLSAGQRRVLTLRAGVGAGPPRSRGGVAKRLNITERRVVRLERTGLRRLRTLGKGGGCAPPSQSQSQSQSATSTAGAVAPLAAATLRTQSSGGEDKGGGGGSGSGGERGKGGGSDSGGSADTPNESSEIGGVAGASQSNPPGSVNLTIPLLLLFLGLAAAATIYLLRRWTAGPVPVTGAPDEPSEAPRPVWIPWRRSTMDGPGWTSAPPPSREGTGEWAAAPGTEPEPQPEPEHHDEWFPPSPRRRVH